MKTQTIYLLIITILVVIIMLPKCSEKTIKIDTSKSDSLTNVVNTVMNDIENYKIKIDSLKNIKAIVKTRYVKSNTVCDTVVMVSEKIIEHQDTVIIKLTEVVTLKDSIIINNDDIHLLEVKALKKKNRHNIARSLLIGFVVGVGAALAVK